jgi:hypothetical protein
MRNTLDAMPVSVTSRKGGTPPAHVWVAQAVSGFQCEGLNPLAPLDKRVFAEQHFGHINRGERFLRKCWISGNGTEFRTRHCAACGDELERLAGLHSNNGAGGE